MLELTEVQRATHTFTNICRGGLHAWMLDFIHLWPWKWLKHQIQWFGWVSESVCHNTVYWAYKNTITCCKKLKWSKDGQQIAALPFHLYRLYKYHRNIKMEAKWEKQKVRQQQNLCCSCSHINSDMEFTWYRDPKGAAGAAHYVRYSWERKNIPTLWAEVRTTTKTRHLCFMRSIIVIHFDTINNCKMESNENLYWLILLCRFIF